MVNFDFSNVKEEYGDNPLDIELLSNVSGAYIAANKMIFNNLDLSDHVKTILQESVKGTPMVKIGKGLPRLMVVAGIHGNELAPPIAALKLIDELSRLELKGTIYIIPFACPKASMDNRRDFDGADLNRAGHIKGSVSNSILDKAKELEVSAIGDFHSTAPNTNPGKEAVFCSENPCHASVQIADFIELNAGSQKIVYEKAGALFKGAVEDESNLMGIPAVTCEVASPIKYADKKIVERSLIQMRSFLSYFGIYDNYIV